MSVRYSFGEFALSPARRLLLRGGREVEIQPRIFDLLLLLIEHRDRALTREDLLDTVWSDVVVSDGALTQAVRALRRTLGDDPTRALYVRTVPRHGYQFVFPDVEEQDDREPLPNDQQPSGAAPATPESAFDAALSELLSDAPEEARVIAAETLHSLDTERALNRLGDGDKARRARALLRDTRWNVPEAGAVPIFGAPRPFATLTNLFALRLRRVLRMAGGRLLSAVIGAATSGLVAGVVGGLALLLGPGSRAEASLPVLLGLVGAVIGGVGAVGVASGLCAAEVLVRSQRAVALVLGGGIGGGAVGLTAHGLGLFLLEGLFGQDLSPITGGYEGIVLGAATGLGYALGAPLPEGGMATPRRAARWRAALGAGLACALSAALLSGSGRYLGAMSLDLLAHRFPGSDVGLEPLARLLGESTPGPATRITIGAWEGFMFASGTVLGLTRRRPVTDR